MRSKIILFLWSSFLFKRKVVAKESKKTRIETPAHLYCARRFAQVAKKSKKIRTETSNLLEKGLIQKTGSGFPIWSSFLF